MNDRQYNVLFLCTGCTHSLMVELLLALPLDKLDRLAREQQLRKISQENRFIQ